MGTIIVTGAAGFIGSNLIKNLLENTSSKIIALDDLSLGKIEFLPLNNKRCIFRKIDISSEKELKNLNDELKDDQIDALWHMAANSDIPAGVKNSSIDFKNTFLTTYGIGEFIKHKNPKQIHFASSSAVYGDHGIKRINEITGPLLPISNYGAFKLSSEAFLSSIVEETNTKLYIYRFPNVVGTPATHGVLFDFINRLKKESSLLKVKGNGTQTKQYLHIDDLISAMMISSEKLNKQRNIINIGPFGGGITVKEIAELTINKFSENSKIIYEKSPRGWKGDIPKFDYDISKLRALGWEPKYKTSKEAIIDSIKEIMKQLNES